MDQEQKRLEDITRKEWISLWWIDVSEFGDPERMMLRGLRRTPDEAAQAMLDWDETAEERDAEKPEERDAEVGQHGEEVEKQ